MSILVGLIGTEQLSNQRFNNVRRTVFYNFPNGAAPLLGLLSVMEAEEEVNDPTFVWYEDRFVERKTTTSAWAAGSNGPFATDAGAALATGSGTTLVPGTTYRLQVVDSSYIRAGSIVKVALVAQYSTSVTFDCKFLVVEVLANNILRFQPLETTYATVSNASTVNIGNEVLVIGSAHSEGAIGSAESGYNLPLDLSNYTQIFRTPFSFTGTEMQTSVKFDKTGDYRDKAKKMSLNHMVDIERSSLFGVQSKSVNPKTNLPLRTSGGIIYRLQQWELTSNNPYGATGATVNSDDNKRIININGALSAKTYDTYLERLFRVTNNQANEKLVFCGSGFLSIINSMYRGQSVLTTDIPQAGIWGNDIVGHRTPYGTIYYKSHPLFSLNSTLRYNALFLDVNNIKYRPMVNRDTDLLRNRQPNNADYREDEYLTEAGFEVRFPESHMYMTGVFDFVP